MRKLACHHYIDLIVTKSYLRKRNMECKIQISNIDAGHAGTCLSSWHLVGAGVEEGAAQSQL